MKKHLVTWKSNFTNRFGRYISRFVMGLWMFFRRKKTELNMFHEGRKKKNFLNMSRRRGLPYILSHSGYKNHWLCKNIWLKCVKYKSYAKYLVFWQKNQNLRTWFWVEKKIFWSLGSKLNDEWNVSKDKIYLHAKFEDCRTSNKKITQDFVIFRRKNRVLKNMFFGKKNFFSFRYPNYQ